MSSPIDPFAPGQSIAQYEILRELGRGGMGRVYLAKDTAVGGRLVAIKVILAADADTADEAHARFFHEIKNLARLDHPNITTIFTAGNHLGHPYFVMKYIPGRDLSRFLDECSMLSERDRIQRILTIMARVARAVYHAHIGGVVHRDLKPANILICEASDEPMVLDFGIAKYLGGDTSLTKGPESPGTPAYRAPEQIDVRRKVRDELMDVWALGVVLYRALCSTHPFKGNDFLSLSMDILNAHPKSPTSLNPDIAQELSQIVLSCLNKDPNLRPASALALAELLEAFSKLTAESGNPPEQATRPLALGEHSPGGLRTAPQRYLILGVAFAFLIAAMAYIVASRLRYGADRSTVALEPRAKLESFDIPSAAQSPDRSSGVDTAPNYVAPTQNTGRTPATEPHSTTKNEPPPSPNVTTDLKGARDVRVDSEKDSARATPNEETKRTAKRPDITPPAKTPNVDKRSNAQEQLASADTATRATPPQTQSGHEPEREDDDTRLALASEHDKAFYSFGLNLSQQLSSLRLTGLEFESIRTGLTDGILRRPSRVDVKAFYPQFQQLAKARVANEVETSENTQNSDKKFYAFGFNLSQQLTMLDLNASECGIVVAGLKDGVLKRTVRADPKEFYPKFQTIARERLTAKAGVEKKTGQDFVGEAAKEKGAIKTASGMVIQTLREGTGDHPGATDKVKVHYTGTLTDGTVFDSSVQRNSPATFPLNGVIKCWTEGVQRMRVGGKAKLVCPSDLAYGDQGRPPQIKPGATLVFEVDLLDIVK